MKDYKLSEVMNICRRHTCATCPLVLVHSGACRFVNVSSPVNWDLDDVPVCQETQDGPDQTQKADAGKLPLTAVPTAIIRAVGEIRYYGMKKYPNGGVDNWKKVDPQRYRDAAFRHFLDYIDHPDGVDKESGLPHLWHLACNIAFLCELEDCSDGSASAL